MKKLYSLLFALLLGAVSLQAQTAPTCSLDPVFVASSRVGIWPDSATNFVSGTVGQPYVQNITVKVPLDTAALGVTLCFNRFELKSPSGATNYDLPAGLNFTVTPALMNSGTIFFPGNANNCASIWGTPTTAGSYTLQLEVQAFATATFSTCPSNPNPQSGSGVTTTVLDYYVINITAPVGIESYGKDHLALYQNSPNPVRGETEIKFYVESEEEASIRIYNALGSLVYEKALKAQVGENTLKVDAGSWTSGVYMYSLHYKGAVTTKRMLVH